MTKRVKNLGLSACKSPNGISDTLTVAANPYIWTRDEAAVASRPINDAIAAMLSARIMRNT